MNDDYEIAPFTFLGKEVFTRKARKGDDFVFKEKRDEVSIRKTSFNTRKTSLFTRVFSRKKLKRNDEDGIKTIKSKD